MFTQPFFKFLAGFLILVTAGVLGAAFSNRYFSAHHDMFANPQQEGR